MIIKKTLAAVISILCITPAFAIEEDIYNAQLSFGWSPVITLSGGPVWSSPGRFQVVHYGDAFGNVLYSSYYPHRKTSTQGAAELFFALQKEVIPCIKAQVGIQIGGVTDSNLKGETVINGIPPALYNYSYNISHMRLGLKTKFISFKSTFVQPYISGGIAASFNQSHIFYSAPTTIFTPYTPWYSKNTITGFAFSLGLGLQKTFCNNWQIGVGYEFDSLGKSQLGIDPNYSFYTDNRGMHLSNWYAHQLQFSLSYSY